jgi:hypothetical protein
VILDGGQESCGFEIGDDALAGLVAVESDIGGRQQLAFFGFVGADGGVGREDVDQSAVRLFGDGGLVAMAQPDLMVVEVVRRGDLDTAGAELGIGVLVGDDGDAPSGQRQLDEGADQVLVTLILWGSPRPRSRRAWSRAGVVETTRN